MSIELQFRTETLIRMVAGALRRVLRTTCLPTVPGSSIDRLQVLDGEITLAQSGPAVEIRVAVDAFVVTDADLFAHPNGTPAGALKPATRLIFPFRVTLDQTALRLTPMKPQGGGPFQPLMDALWTGLEPHLKALAVPVAPLVKALRTALPGAPDVVTGDGVVAGRFGGAGPAVSRLAPGQDWGLFLGADSVTGMIRNLIEPHLNGALSVLKVDAQYRNEAGQPGVGVTVGAGIDVLGLVGLGASISLDSTLRLLVGPPPVLRIAADWSVDIETALLVPIFGFWALAMKPVAEAAARKAISSALDVTSFGATPTGQTSFVLDENLPPLAFGPVALRYDSLVATDAGMVLGGIAVLPVVANPPFRFEASRFGGPSRIQRCRDLAKTGSGAPSRDPLTIYNTDVYARAEVRGAGRFCRIEMRSPGPQVRHLVATLADGSMAEDFDIESKIRTWQGLALQGPLSFVLRTPCGVRFVDFGKPPPPRVDENGHLIGVLDAYIKNCNYVIPRRRGRWGIGWHFEKEDFIPRPPEEPGWNRWLHESGGLDVQLVQLTGLDPGEFVRFRSGAHAIEATADAEGRLALPVLLPNRERAAPALLERADGRPLAGHLRVDSAVFEPVATLPGVPLGPARSISSGGLQLDMPEERGAARYTLSAFGLTRTGLTALNPQPLPPGGDDAAALNPQPLPPGGDDLAALNPQPLPPVADGAWSADRLRRTGIRDVEEVFAIPGFADRPVAVARLGDGSSLLLDLAGTKPRVAGVLRGPFGALDVTEGFALAREREQVTLFRRPDAPAPALPAVPPAASLDVGSAV